MSVEKKAQKRRVFAVFTIYNALLHGVFAYFRKRDSLLQCVFALSVCAKWLKTSCNMQFGLTEMTVAPCFCAFLFCKKTVAPCFYGFLV